MTETDRENEETDWIRYKTRRNRLLQMNEKWKPYFRKNVRGDAVFWGE